MLQFALEKLNPLPAGHEHFVRIAPPAGALSAGVPDSDKKTFALFAPSRFNLSINTNHP